jgi:hypothetical protein
VRAGSSSRAGDYGDERANESDYFGDADLQQKWQYVVNYCPETDKQYKSLSRISTSLSFVYKVSVLNRKIAGNSAAIELAETMKSEYMGRYFGDNEDIHEFVMHLFTRQRRDIALEINNAIRILGVPDSDNVAKFLERIREKYKVDEYGRHDYIRVLKDSKD